MKFKDLLNSPLPSSTDNEGDSFLEGGDEFDFDKEMKDTMKGFEESEGGMSEDLVGDISELLGGDDEDYEDEDDLDAELADAAAAVGLDTDGEEEIPEPEEVKPAAPLKGTEDEEADAMMAAVGTPVLIDECMTVQEAADFLESGDADVAIAEGLMLESALDDMISDISSYGMSEEQAYTESVFAPESRPFKMTKKARLNQLYELSLQIEARAHHDALVPKIQKAYEIERKIKAVWRKKYGSLAMRRAIKYLKRLQKSKAEGLKKAATAILPKKK